MTSTHTLADPRVEAALARLFEHADHDDDAAARVSARWPNGYATVQEHADAAAEIYIPISPEGGRLLYSLIRATRPTNVIEFGTSFGVSTLYLAAGVRDNGSGRVISTEMSRTKIDAARRTFAEVGLDNVITVLEGDARETLAGFGDSPDFLFLDGWKDLCLSVLHLLEPRIVPGTLIVADDVNMRALQPYLEYVRSSANGYESVTFPVGDGMEISCRL
jgi:predicted O-methyltransferase YrrM